MENDRDTEVDSLGPHPFTTRKLKESLDATRQEFKERGGRERRDIVKRLRFHADEMPVLVPKRYLEGQRLAHRMLRETVEELEKDLFEAVPEKPPGKDEQEAQPDSVTGDLRASLKEGADVFEDRETAEVSEKALSRITMEECAEGEPGEAEKRSDGSPSKSALKKGTGVFEGREDSPGVALDSYGMGTGVFEGREDSPDGELIVKIAECVELKRSRMATAISHGRRCGRV